MSSSAFDSGIESYPAACEIEPQCRHFGVCGGCQLQHLTQATQVGWKAKTVRSRLQKAGVCVSEIQTHTASEYHYRNRIRLRVVGGRVGYSRRASHEFLPVVECPIASPLLWKAAEHLEGIASGPAPWPQACNEVELVTNAEESALQLLLHVDATVQELSRDAPSCFRRLCDALHEVMPQLAGAGLLVHGEMTFKSKRVQERQRIEVARWGTPELIHTVNGENYTVSRGAFFQVNRFLTGRMVELALKPRCGRLAWDLFAGAGLFAVPLARRFQEVVAVEIGQPAATDLAGALRHMGFQHRTVVMPVTEFLKRSGKVVTPELILMDPPRAGLGFTMVQQLASIGAPELIYISCDAGTFARDARALVDSRYAVTELHLLDLFPQTIHTETIAVFRRT